VSPSIALLPETVVQPLPSIEVWTNGIKATCATPLATPSAPDAPWPDASTTPVATRPCTYVYSSALAASATSATPSTVSQGSTLSIQGSGFAVTPFVQLISVANSSVTADCDVASFTSTSVTCVVGPGQSGAYQLRVVVGEWRCADRPETTKPPAQLGTVYPSHPPPPLPHL
jgi:hypothetical protein